MSSSLWPHPAYEVVATLLSARTGLVLSPGRVADTAAGIRRAMQKAGVSDVRRYLELLQGGQVSFDDLVAEVTIGETYFFRDPAQFEFIRQEVIPDIRRRHAVGHILRAWSAGCASGEEPYSLAILFDEESLGAHAVHILATDISRSLLAMAHEASYTVWSLRGNSEAFVARYFRTRGPRWFLDGRFRTRVRFDYLNLAIDAYPSWVTGTWGMDLILCRNVFIYLKPETVQEVARRLFECLAEGGWLVTGVSDPPLRDSAPFEAIATPCGVVYRRAECRAVERSGEETRSGTAAGPPDDEKGQAGVLSTARTVSAPGIGPMARPAPEDSASTANALPAAQEALKQGHYARAAELAHSRPDDPLACVIEVRAQACLRGSAHAVQQAAEAAQRHPACAELHLLHALLLMDLGRNPEASQAVRRALYLDRSLAIGYFVLGTVLQSEGDVSGALRAYRNARDLSATRPPDEVIACSEGESASRLAEASAAKLAILDAASIKNS
ncbi:MAG: protein-glutamate O-methyltransferase CheR [Planctomycetes bacterium]|nr:protein-glutamate O-methyltransferase CheR [Planctomycetota bacterium]